MFRPGARIFSHHVRFKSSNPSVKSKRVLEYRPSSVKPTSVKPSVKPTGSTSKPRRAINPRVWIWGIPVYAVLTYGAYLYTSLRRAREASAGIEGVVDRDVSDRYDTLAPTYDSEVGTAEWVMGMHKLRRQLTQKARGNVLEVSVGTGRNAEYYPLPRCRSVTMVDKSGEMVAMAKEKFQRHHPGYEKVQFVTSDASTPLPSVPVRGFDTVIQTIGLCSVADPVKLLRNLEKVVAPDGQILLLEHGRSHYAWLNEILDSLAPGHADRYGCWWNRDIGDIIRQSGLEVKEMKRYHLGTTWWVELRRPL